ncbi:MAG: radical SAM family heme chaperone HemW [Candidatus Omnitrophica bacterium]|nr:radical SAM family heme chaperone HemW [Candidatus Omnitrophota bacterium]
MKSLYIHVPFCSAKCFYCSFAVVVGRETEADEYIQCLEKEMFPYRGMIFSTVYVGGGTPGILSGSQIARLFDMIRREFNIAKDAEITFEVNPENVNAEKMDILRRCGVNRLSVGLQSLDPRRLFYLGRKHTVEQSRAAIFTARKAGLKNISVDWMFGFKDQTISELKLDARRIIDLGAEHISSYALSVEPNSLFSARRESSISADNFAEYYQAVTEHLEQGGYQQYEISNYSRPGFQSRHNIQYWQCSDYIGLGMAAHSHIQGHRYWNHARLGNYMAAVRKTGSGMEGEEHLENRLRFKEAFLVGLRMNGGIGIADYEKRFNERLSTEEKEKIDGLVRDGFLKYSNNSLSATDKGRIVLDEICARLF